MMRLVSYLESRVMSLEQQQEDLEDVVG